MIFSFRIDNLSEQLIACLRKGNESEGKLAATLSSLLFVQMGESNDELYQRFRDALLPILRDATKSTSLRTHVSQYLFIILVVEHLYVYTCFYHLLVCTSYRHYLFYI
jgi:hypothetical protein